MLLCVGCHEALSEFRVIGYFPSWQGSVSNIQFDKLTSVNYAFLLPTSTGGLQAIENPSKLEDLVSAAHARNVKVYIAVGGWNNGNDSAFESLAASSSRRTTFVNNLVNFVNQYNLDGVDMDWEYPDPGSSATNYAALMQQLSTELHTRGKLLSAAVIAEGSTGGGVLNSVFGYVDHLNLMAYDYNDFQHSTYDHAVSSIMYWKNRGLPTSKTILGVPFYGRPTWESFAQLVARGANPNADVYQNVGYNGITTIKSKTNLAFDQGGGIMMWELSQDATGSNSLLSAIDQVVQERGGSEPPSPLEAENLARTTVGAATALQSDSNASGGTWVALQADGTGDYVEYTLPNVPAGTYTVKMRYKIHPNRGILQLALDGNNLGSTLDQYSATVAYPETTFGQVTFAAAGNHVVRLTVTGKNAAAGAFTLSADRFALTPTTGGQPGGTFQSESLTVENSSGDTIRVLNETAASGGKSVIMDSNAVGDYVTFRIPNIAAGTYSVRVGIKKHPSRGIVQALIGKIGGSLGNLGSAVDQYAASSGYTEVVLGTWTPGSTSDKQIQFKVTGKNASSSGFTLCIDYVKLVPQ
jgi:chitinase